ncbi:MAG: hypothetical protein ACYDAY_09550 [Candidatus Dormibacteria bacterium]
MTFLWPRGPEPLTRGQALVGFALGAAVAALVDTLLGVAAGLAAGWRVGVGVALGMLLVTTTEMGLVAVFATRRNSGAVRQRAAGD